MAEFPEEKRVCSRILDSAAVESTRLPRGASQGRDDLGLSRNIGIHGICVTTKNPYAPGDVLSLKIHLKGWRGRAQDGPAAEKEGGEDAPLTVVVDVAWCKKISGQQRYETGVRFREIDEEDRRALNEYLDRIS